MTLGLRRLCEAREAAQVREHHRDVAPVTRERISAGMVGEDEIGDLRRQESTQPFHASDLLHLLGDPMFEKTVPVRELSPDPAPGREGS